MDVVPGGRQKSVTWHIFAGILCQVGSRTCHLARFCGKTVAGGDTPTGTYCGAPPVLPAQRAPSLLGSRCRLRPLNVPVIPHSLHLYILLFPASQAVLDHIGRPREMPAATLLLEFRGRWKAENDTWNAFAGIPWQVNGRKVPPGTLDFVPGGQHEMPPGTLLRENRGRWTAGMRHLAHFCGDSVAGGRQGKTPGTLLQEFRGRWKAENDTWNAFAGIPWQVNGRKVPPGTLKVPPGTLLQGFRARWTA